MKKILITGLVLGTMLQMNAQNYWKNKTQRTAKLVITNSATNEKLSDKGLIKFEKFAQPKETDACIFVDPDFKYQKLIGIGGAITDASAETLYKMSKAKQKEILEAYYGKNGLGYTLVRTNMNSCDFSSESYTYVKDGDTSLKSFSVAHDEKYKIPMIKEAQKLIGKDFTFYFSPWSPPAWMKSNKSMLKGGRLEEKYYQTWADYYVKFINEYQKRGINVWGLTIQNEPMATQTWESCIYTAEEEGNFLKNNLGPTLWKNGFKDKKVIIWDHNRDLIYQRATTTLQDPETAKYANGIGYHWYETWNNKTQLFDNLTETQRAFPNMFLAFTEGCKEQFKMDGIYDVSLGELYGRNMLNDFNKGTALWTDWNVLLDETGGPNHVGNFCFAPIIADTKTGEVHYTYEYYYIGQVSKFIKPGAQRIGNSSNRAALLSTAFMNENGELVTVIMNESDKDTDAYLWIEGEAAKLSVPAHSIQTVIL
ncbi:glycoside hydrolase family 30 protein [Kaistella montana]|uniref:Glycoside hydrolase family 30 beta sandwich domain-containing protein n=1 Tax=Kaistella montana TaxID=1849733 RepID=A0ABW5K6H3_9FLAO|nr:glycoside hydrolase family 30 protein [Kaistella montana]MCQ4034819.1 glycosyl hydrolase [Kaistella montana]